MTVKEALTPYMLFISFAIYSPQGYLYDKKAILEYILHQKTEIARKMKVSSDISPDNVRTAFSGFYYFILLILKGSGSACADLCFFLFRRHMRSKSKHRKAATSSRKSVRKGRMLRGLKPVRTILCLNQSTHSHLWKVRFFSLLLRSSNSIFFYTTHLFITLHSSWGHWDFNSVTVFHSFNHESCFSMDKEAGGTRARSEISFGLFWKTT